MGGIAKAIGGIFGGAVSGSAEAVAAPPPPPPPPAPTPPSYQTPVNAAGTGTGRSTPGGNVAPATGQAGDSGFAGTIITGPEGLKAPPLTSDKKLLGS